ncbi:chromosome partitioning protein ParA [Sporanaerobium hydrogeniformans]|uniref:Chromosome partitioning protein ParA n=1 Tax=Sporanaerobium hydrogeniformans TaxID=3072179 RepID=A0AC61DBP2_9FIRM|nr:DUF1015 family protein [Sporanaerobium hydrogeniformans]PHV70651.1 chromosome partitioning protein ParA [Sporanaerobium hydrogeniformans]
MITLKAFKGFRPKEDLAHRVAALPYDVMNTVEAKKMVEGNPYSFLHVDKPEMHVPTPQEDELYAFAGSKLDQMIKENVFIQDEASLYLYVLTNAYTTQYGIVGCVSAQEYEQGLIKKHENTRTDKEEDRIKHVTYCKAHTGPIFLAYKGLEMLTAWVINYADEHMPLYDFTSEDNVRHVVYRLEAKDQEYVIASFKEADALYIADGHHRAAAAVAVAKKNRDAGTATEANQHFLATIFPKDQLHIMDYNRVLKDESGLTKEALFEHLATYFEIEAVLEETYKPEKRHTFGMRYAKTWYKLTLKSEWEREEDPVAALDVSVLQRYILEPIFKIMNPKEDKRIDFVGGIRGLKELNRRTEEDMDVAFSLYPTSMDELIRVADQGALMPPKSTWFEPKLRSGLFVHKMD